jgi:hypothetical protein
VLNSVSGDLFRNFSFVYFLDEEVDVEKTKNNYHAQESKGQKQHWVRKKVSKEYVHGDAS